MYGLLQKRIVGENQEVPKVDESKDMKQDLTLNQRRFGKVTKYLAIDCEMDYHIPQDQTREEFDAENDDPVGLNFNVKNPGLVCKITCVN